MTEPIARIEAALKRLGEEHEPPLGWEARVLAATAPPKPKPRWWWFTAPAGAAAMVALVALFWPPKRPLIEISLNKKGSTMRSGTLMGENSAHLGDAVTATARGHYRAVWVYHNDALVVKCPGESKQCQSSDDSTTAMVELTLYGEYQVIALSSESPVPAPTGVFDTDSASASKADTTKTEKFAVH